MSVSDHGENQLLGALPATLYVKLHLADPGEAGTSSPAAETARKAVTMGAASGGSRKNTTAAEFTNVAATETYTHVSFWDAASGGNCWGSGPLAEAKAMVLGESIVFAANELTYSLD